MRASQAAHKHYCTTGLLPLLCALPIRRPRHAHGAFREIHGARISIRQLVVVPMQLYSNIPQTPVPTITAPLFAVFGPDLLM